MSRPWSLCRGRGDKNPANGLRAIGGAVNLTLLVKIRAWITYCSAALSAYTEDAAPAWVHSLRDVVAQYNVPGEPVSDDETEFRLHVNLEQTLVRPSYRGTWRPTPCAARAELHGPLGTIVLVQSTLGDRHAKTIVEHVRGVEPGRVETHDATLPADVLPVHVEFERDADVLPELADARSAFHFGAFRARRSPRSISEKSPLGVSARRPHFISTSTMPTAVSGTGCAK